MAQRILGGVGMRRFHTRNPLRSKLEVIATAAQWISSTRRAGGPSNRWTEGVDERTVIGGAAADVFGPSAGKPQEDDDFVYISLVGDDSAHALETDPNMVRSGEGTWALPVLGVERVEEEPTGHVGPNRVRSCASKSTPRVIGTTSEHLPMSSRSCRAAVPASPPPGEGHDEVSPHGGEAEAASEPPLPHQSAHRGAGGGVNSSPHEGQHGDEHGLAVYAHRLRVTDVARDNIGGGEPQTTLPYDDEKFAEMILEMEVDGALDEAWQDSRKANAEDAAAIVEILRTMKVRDLCCVDVSQKTGNFDYMIMGTCEGARHIHLAAWATQEADKLQVASKVRRKQTDHLWESIPVGRIIVNLMQESYREQLSLERKWTVTRTMDPMDIANAPISEGRQVKAHGLWTLTLNLQDLEDFEVDYCKDVLMRQR